MTFYRRSCYAKVTDDSTITLLVFLPTIRRSLGRFCSPGNRRSHLGFFVESYRRSYDHISVFVATVTDDLTIKLWFFCRKLPTIRRSHFSFFPGSYQISDDHTSVFSPQVRGDSVRNTQQLLFCQVYRRSDDHTQGTYLNVTDDPKCDDRRSSLRFIFAFITDDPTIIFYRLPTITVFNFVQTFW